MSLGKPSTKIELIKLLRESPNLSAQQIALALGMHYRSVYRVIETCIEDGYSIIHENKRFRLRNQDRDQVIIDFSLTAQQAHDLVVASKGIKTLTPHAEEALEQIKVHLAGSNLDQEAGVYYHSYDKIDAEIYRIALSGIRHRKALNITYEPKREGVEAKKHIFDPYKVIFWNGHYYLVGCSRAYAHKPSKGIMHLRLDRISKINIAIEVKTSKETGNEYQQSLTFSKSNFVPKAYVEGVFGTFGGKQEAVNISVYFPAKVAQAAADVDRHPSKKLEWQADGSLLYHLTVPLSPEIVWWVSSWSGAQVIQPLELREQVYTHALEIARLNAPDSVPVKKNSYGVAK